MGQTSASTYRRGVLELTDSSIGSSHLPADSIDHSDDTEDTSLKKFHEAVLDEIAHCHWGWVGKTAAVTKPPPESSSSESSSPEPILKARGIDPTTVFFKRDDVILLVDGGFIPVPLTPDMLDARAYMRSIFEPFCTVIEARDGQEALDMLNDNKDNKLPDLIIADILLPKVGVAIQS